MNIFAWVLQALLAVAFLLAGLMKVSQPKEKLGANPNMGWTNDFSAGTIRLIGTLEILAAIGLVLPAWTGIAPWLTPLAAVGLILLMLGAATTHYRRKEPQPIVVNTVLLLLAAVVAWARFGPYSY